MLTRFPPRPLPIILSVVTVAVGLTLVTGAWASPRFDGGRVAAHRAPHGDNGPNGLRDNAIRIWNFTSVPRDIDGTVYQPGGGSGVAHGNPAYINVQGCNKLEFFNPPIAYPWFRFTYGDQHNGVAENEGHRYTSEQGNVYFVGRHEDSDDYIEWEVEVISCK